MSKTSWVQVALIGVALSAIIAISAAFSTNTLFATTPETTGTEETPSSPVITVEEYREMLSLAGRLLDSLDETRPNTYIYAAGQQQSLPAASTSTSHSSESKQELRAPAPPAIEPTTEPFDYSKLAPGARQTVSWDTAHFSEAATSYAIWRKVEFKKQRLHGGEDLLFETEYQVIVEDDYYVPDELWGTSSSDTGSTIIHYGDEDVLPFVEYNYAITPLQDGVPMTDAQGETLFVELEGPKVPEWHDSLYIYSHDRDTPVLLFQYTDDAHTPGRRAVLELQRKVLGDPEFTSYVSVPLWQTDGQYSITIVLNNLLHQGIIAYKTILRDVKTQDVINTSGEFYIQQGPRLLPSSDIPITSGTGAEGNPFGDADPLHLSYANPTDPYSDIAAIYRVGRVEISRETLPKKDGLGVTVVGIGGTGLTTMTDWGREYDTIYSYVVQPYTYDGYTGPEPRESLRVEPFGPEESRLGNILVLVDGQGSYYTEEFPWPTSLTKGDPQTGRTYHRIYADIRGGSSADRVESFRINVLTRHPGATFVVRHITHVIGTRVIGNILTPDSFGFYGADMSREDRRADMQIIVVEVTPESGSEERVRHYSFVAACWSDVDTFRDSSGRGVPTDKRCAEGHSLSLEDSGLNDYASSN